MSNDAVAEAAADAKSSHHRKEHGGDEISPEMFKKLDGIIERYKDKPGSLIPVLQQAQEVCGYLPHRVQRYIAEGMKISPSVVFGVTTFYSYFTIVPRGKHVARVCLGTACYVKRSEEILDKLKKELGIDVGEITKDRKFSLEAVRCLGACGLAPVMVVGQDTYGAVDPNKVLDILKKYE